MFFFFNYLKLAVNSFKKNVFKSIVSMEMFFKILFFGCFLMTVKMDCILRGKWMQKQIMKSENVN